MRRHDDAASLEIALIENMAREDLNPVEEARACAALVEELGLTREDVGLRVGRSRVAVSNLIRLLDLPDEALELIERGDLTEGHGRALLLADDHAERRSLARDAAGEPLVGPRARVPRPRRPAAQRPAKAPAPAPADRSTPTRQAAIEQIADALERGARPRRRGDARQGAGYRVQLALRLARRRARPGPALRPRARRLSRPTAHVPVPATAVRIGPAGRLAQSVRALL